MTRRTAFLALPVAANAAGDELQIGDSRAAYTHNTPARKTRRGGRWRQMLSWECTGKFNDAEQAGEHLQAGARRVLSVRPVQGGGRHRGLWR